METKVKPQIVWLEPGDHEIEEQDYILIEGDNDGTCYANGVGQEDGEDRMYISTLESDNTLVSGLEAALKWASHYQVKLVFVKKTGQ